MQDAAGEFPLRDEEGDIRSDFLHAVSHALETEDAARVRALTLDLHEGDLADLIQVLRPDERAALIATLGDDFNVESLPELDEPVRDQVLEDMIDRCRELDLRLCVSAEETKLEFAILLTAHTMDYLHAGRYRFAL